MVRGLCRMKKGNVGFLGRIRYPVKTGPEDGPQTVSALDEPRVWTRLVGLSEPGLDVASVAHTHERIEPLLVQRGDVINVAEEGLCK